MNPVIARHKTAMSRATLSRPLSLALRENVLRQTDRVFDYGCGLGDDIERLSSLGINSSGWDPAHFPNNPLAQADLVNLGYVINVIEEPKEREQALRSAWQLASRLLVVSARTREEANDLVAPEQYSDGLRTQLNTFQKFFSQTELKTWIDENLGTSSVPAGLGVFFVFRSEQDRQFFIASRYRRALVSPKLSLSDQLYAENEDRLQPLLDFFLERGRVPRAGEIQSQEEIEEIFGSLKKAFLVVRRATGEEQWSAISMERQEDLRVYLALSKFDRNAKWSNLPSPIQYDVREFFGTYKKAMEDAQALLFSLGAPGEVEQACVNSTIGKLTPTALYVHSSALDELSPLLRAYEGCGRGYLGEVEAANIVKIFRNEPKISYLSYPNFDHVPHPELDFSLNLNLTTFSIKLKRFRGQKNVPILHRKDTFVSASHPSYEKFLRLTEQEERHGLLSETSRIGLKTAWLAILKQSNWQLRGHRLVRIKQTDQTK